MWLPGALTDTLLRFTAQFILPQTNPRHLEDHHFPAFDKTSWGKITTHSLEAARCIRR